MNTTTPAGRYDVCLDCDRHRLHQARGLCGSCWQRHRRNGTLDDYPTRLSSREVLLEDWRFLEAQGYSRREAAERMGIKRDRLDKAIERDRRAREHTEGSVAA